MRIDCLIMSVQKESEGERMIEGRSRVFSFFFFYGGGLRDEGSLRSLPKGLLR